MSIQRYPLTLSFKGERDYIQGPDIFDAVIQALCAGAETTRVAQIDVAFHRLARRAVELINDDQGSAMDPVAICQYSIDGVRRQAFVVETGTEIVERHPYPEEDIIERMSIDTDQRTCALDIDLPFTDMELWVSMTKALHKSALSRAQRQMAIRPRPLRALCPGCKRFSHTGIQVQLQQ